LGSYLYQYAVVPAVLKFDVFLDANSSQPVDERK